MTIEQARKQAARINAEIEEGSNPAEVKRAHRDEMTFADLFKEYGQRHGNKNALGKQTNRFTQITWWLSHPTSWQALPAK